jgi:hypothetical protein
MLRNPWGKVEYNKSWNSNDTRWTDELVKQVPLGVDPRVDQTNNGVFIIPLEEFFPKEPEEEKCF